jgi:hypothetical protein
MKCCFFRTREASSKLLDLLQVSNPNDVGCFHQITVPCNDHDLIFLSCCFERSRVATAIDQDGLSGTAAPLDWSTV